MSQNTFSGYTILHHTHRSLYCLPHCLPHHCVITIILSGGSNKSKDTKEKGREEGKEGGREEDMKRDGQVVDKKDAKESGSVDVDDDAPTSPTSPTTVLISINSPTTRTTTEDKHHISPTEGGPINASNNANSSGTINSTIIPTAAPSSGSRKGSLKGSGKGSGSGSGVSADPVDSTEVLKKSGPKNGGMLTSIERKKLALVTKNRRNSWSGKSPVKPFGLISPQPSGKLTLLSPEAVELGLGLGLVHPLAVSPIFSPGGPSPRIDLYKSASVDVYDHDNSNDNGNDNSNDNGSGNRSDRESLAQRRAKVNRRRSAPLFVHYNEREGSDASGNEDETTELEDEEGKGQSLNSKPNSKSSSKPNSNSKILLSPRGNLSPLFSPYASRPIPPFDGSAGGTPRPTSEANPGIIRSPSNLSRPNLPAIHDGSSSSSRGTDGHSKQSAVNDGGSGNDKDDVSTTSITSSLGNSSQHKNHDKANAGKETSDSEHHGNRSSSNSGSSSSRVRENHPSAVIVSPQENNSTSVRRGAVQVPSPAHPPSVGQTNASPSSTIPPPNGVGESVLIPGDLTGNLSTLRQFTTVRKFHTATKKMGVRNPQRRGKHGEIMTPSFTNLYEKGQSQSLPYIFTLP